MIEIANRTARVAVSMLFTQNARLPSISRVVVILSVISFGILTAATPGFLSVPSLAATIDLAALMGLVAIGMTFITISGSLLSLALGATLATSAVVFTAATPWGLFPAILSACCVGVSINLVQGALIGFLRANPIIVSVAALSLLTGAVLHITGGVGIYPDPATNISWLHGRVGPFDAQVIVFIGCAVVGEFILLGTRFGRELLLVGSNFRAAEAAGISASRVVFVAYGIAGFFAAIAGIMAAARLQMASFEIGIGYDYDAIAAVLIGGTLISGGRGSVLRTAIGAIVFASITTLLVLWGTSQEVQRIMTGVILLAAIAVHAGDKR